jgi:glycerol-3-phosphate dehydrogenase
VHDRAYGRGEIAHLVRAEQVVHLDDLLLRRTSLAFVGGLTRGLVEEVADIAAAELGWDAARRDAEITAVTELLRDRHGVALRQTEATAA